MNISNEDLERVKESRDKAVGSSWDAYGFIIEFRDFDNLLARLEAAENPARGEPHNHGVIDIYHHGCERCKADESWRKACGNK